MNTEFVTRSDRTFRLVRTCVTGFVACSLLTLPCFAQSTVAQHPWQQMQMPTAAEAARVWVNPPSEYGPEPYFGMNGPVTIESLAKDLDMMKSLGFHAVTAQAGGGMTTTYLSPEYFAFFKQFALEAKKRDLKVWIVDDIGYPSGFAGGIFADSKGKHDLSMQALSLGQRLPVAAGATLKQAAGGDVVSATAVNAAGERVAVPITAGAIDWTAPADKGDWTVMLVQHVFRTSPTKSDTNPTHAKDSSQPLEDYLSPEATTAYIEATHDGYYKAMPELFGSTILGFRGDEPDYSIAGLPWTPDFFATFQRVKGYDVRPYLGAILLSQGGGHPRPPANAAASGAPPSDPAFIPAGPPTPPVKLSDAELRAKGDYYDVFSQMFRDGFFKPQGVWCAAHGVAYQVHLNHEEMEMDLTRSEGDFIRDMKYVEEPGIDAIWHQIWTDTVSDYPRLASSAAHLYGHPQSFTESFAAYRPAPDITLARYILNEQLVRGINVMETMFYSATRPQGAAPEAAATTPLPGAAAGPPRRGGPSAVMRDPGFPALADYVRRVGYVLSMGRPAASVALYLPSSSMWLNDRDSDTAFVASEQMLSERQIDFDIINLDALATDLKAGPGWLETMSGNRYRTVIVPSAAVISQAELDRLKTFAKGGGKVLFLGRTPALISQKTILDARAATAADFAWATVETSAQLPPTPTPPAQAPATPPGPQVVPAAIETALTKVVPAHDVALDQAATSLRVVTRQLKDAKVYFLFNEGAEALARTMTLPGPGATVELWDPATGTVSRAASTGGKSGLSVRLELPAYGTELVVVR